MFFDGAGSALKATKFLILGHTGWDSQSGLDRGDRADAVVACIRRVAGLEERYRKQARIEAIASTELLSVSRTILSPWPGAPITSCVPIHEILGDC
jgi:hypothetical protein